MKDILSDNATVADLREVLGLRELKLEDIKEEETRVEKDPDKTSVIEIAKATEDKTNEEEVDKKEVTEEHKMTRGSWKPRIRVKNSKKQ